MFTENAPVKILLLNDGGFADMADVNFPVQVFAYPYCETGYDVPICEILRIGANADEWLGMESAYWLNSEVEEIK